MPQFQEETQLPELGSHQDPYLDKQGPTQAVLPTTSSPYTMVIFCYVLYLQPPILDQILYHTVQFSSCTVHAVGFTYPDEFAEWFWLYVQDI